MNTLKRLIADLLERARKHPGVEQTITLSRGLTIRVIKNPGLPIYTATIFRPNSNEFPLREWYTVLANWPWRVTKDPDYVKRNEHLMLTAEIDAA